MNLLKIIGLWGARPARRSGFCSTTALFGLALAVLAGSSRRADAATATISVTPSTVSNLYSGNITLQITGTGLTNGETVLVERFLDLNANGAIDAGEPLVQSFRL